MFQPSNPSGEENSNKYFSTGTSFLPVVGAQPANTQGVAFQGGYNPVNQPYHGNINPNPNQADAQPATGYFLPQVNSQAYGGGAFNGANTSMPVPVPSQNSNVVPEEKDEAPLIQLSP